MPGLDARAGDRLHARQLVARGPEVVAEVERYIAWPGQATSYKVGQIRIRAGARARKKRWDRTST